MINRRIPTDDARGMGEDVDEIGTDGYGYRISSTYYLSFVADTQRLMQQVIDSPAQVFYSQHA